MEHDEGDIGHTGQLSAKRDISSRGSDDHSGDDDRPHNEQGGFGNNNSNDNEPDDRTGYIPFSPKAELAYTPRVATASSTPASNKTGHQGALELSGRANTMVSQPHADAQANSTSSWSLLDMCPKPNEDTEPERVQKHVGPGTPVLDVSTTNAKSRFHFSTGYPRAVSSNPVLGVGSQSDHKQARAAMKESVSLSSSGLPSVDFKNGDRPAEAAMKEPVSLSSVALPDRATSASASSPTETAKKAKKAKKVLQNIFTCHRGSSPAVVCSWCRREQYRWREERGWLITQAASEGNFEVVRFLLAHGANANLGVALANARRVCEKALH